MKSANALSGLMPAKFDLFCGFTCNRRHTEMQDENYFTKRSIVNFLQGGFVTACDDSLAFNYPQIILSHKSFQVYK